MKYLIFCFLFMMASAGFAQVLPELIPYRKGDLWGYADPKRKVVIRPEYDEVYFFEGQFAKVKVDRKLGLINKTGKKLTPVKYDEIYSFSEGLARFQEGKRQGFLDTLGREAIILTDSLSFSINSKGHDFKEGLAVVQQEFLIKRGEIIGYENGEEIVNQYDHNSYKFGYIDKAGKVVIKPTYYHAGSFYNGIAKVKRFHHLAEGKLTLINKQNKELLSPPQFLKEKVIVSDKPYYLIVNYKKISSAPDSTFYKFTGVGVYDNQLNKIIPPRFKNIEKLYDSLLVVTDTKGKKGIYNITTGKRISNIRFDRYCEASSQTILLKDKDKICLISKNGKVLIPFVPEEDILNRRQVLRSNKSPYYTGHSRYNEYYSATKGSKIYLYLVSQEKLLIKECAEIYPVSDSLLVYYQPKLTVPNNPNAVTGIPDYDQIGGVIDLDGREIIPPGPGIISVQDTLLIQKQKFLTKVFSLNGEKIRTIKTSQYDTQRQSTQETLAKTFISEADLFPESKRSCYHVHDSLTAGTRIIYNSCAPGDFKYGVITGRGKIIIPFQFQQILKINENLLAVQQLNKWGIMQANGQLLEPIDFDSIRIYNSKLFLLSANFYKTDISRRFLFNGNGELIQDFNSRVSPHIVNGNLHQVDSRYNISEYGVVTKATYKRPLIDDYDYPGLKRTEANPNWLVIDYNGKLIMPAVYPNQDSLVKALAGGNYGSCKLPESYNPIPEDFEKKKYLAEGKWWTTKNGVFYIVFEYGRTLKTERFTSVQAFSEGLAAVSRRDKTGFIDEKGKVIIPFLFDYAEKFKNGVAVITINNKRGLIDKTGKFLIPARYSEIVATEKGRIYGRKGDYWFTFKPNGTVTDSSKVKPFPNAVTAQPAKPISKAELELRYTGNPKKKGRDLYFTGQNNNRLIIKNIETYTLLTCNLIAVKLPADWIFTDENGNDFYEPDIAQHLVLEE